MDAYFSISSIFIGEVMGKKFGGMTISLSFFIYGVGSVVFVIINLYIFNWRSDVAIFGFTIASASCYWGLLAKGGAKGVGKFTTTSVVTSLLLIPTVVSRGVP